MSENKSGGFSFFRGSLAVFLILFPLSGAKAAYLDEARGQDSPPKPYHRPKAAPEGEHSESLFDMIFGSKPVKRFFFGEAPEEEEEKIDEQGDIERAISGGAEKDPEEMAAAEEEKKRQEEEKLLGALPPPEKPREKINIIGDISGEWIFHYQPVGPWGDPPNPMIKLIGQSKKEALEIMLIQQMSDFRRSHAPYAARDYFSVKVSSKYFECNGAPIKLWFDHGKWFDNEDYISTGPTVCHEENEGGENEQEEEPEKEVIGQSSPRDMKESKKLAYLINNFHPIALSQGTKALLVNYGDSSPLYRFARANNPLTNRGYFDSKKAYFRMKAREAQYEDSRRHARGRG